MTQEVLAEGEEGVGAAEFVESVVEGEADAEVDSDGEALVESEGVAEDGADMAISPRDILNLANAERAKVGAGPVRGNNKLTAACSKHSADMARNNFMSHTGSDGSSFGQRIKREGYSFGAAAENVASGQRNAEGVMRSWMNSAGHRRNILNSRYNEMGYAENSRKHTQIFAASRSAMTQEVLAEGEEGVGAAEFVESVVEGEADAEVDSDGEALVESEGVAEDGADMAISPREILNLANAERAKVGAGPVRGNNKLTAACSKHSADMARNNFMSHTGSDGSSFGQRISREGYSFG